MSDVQHDERATSDALPITTLSARTQESKAKADAASKAYAKADAPESTNGDQTYCAICFDGPKSHVAVPCFHQIVCGSCASKIASIDNRCPICRAPVQMWGPVRMA